MNRVLVVLVATTLLALPIAVAAQDASAEALPEPGTPLAPGRYASEAVGPRIDFRVEEGWRVGVGSDAPIFTLERTDLPGTVVTVTRFDGEAFADSCEPTSLTQVEPTVQRLVEIIAGNPFLVAGPPDAIDVDGFRGITLDVATPATEGCALPFLLIWALPMEDGEFVQVPGQQSRFIVLDVDDAVVVIAIESFPGVPFGGLLEASMDLVASMRIEPGEVPLPSTPEPSPLATPKPPVTPTPISSATPRPILTPQPEPTRKPGPSATPETPSGDISA